MSDGKRESTERWVLLPALELTDIGHHRWPGRGDTYYIDVAGRNVQLYVTEKRKKIRVFIDHQEWKAQ